MAAIDPMHQFLIHKVVALPPVPTPLGPLDMSITNSVAAMLSAALVISAFFMLSARRQIVPGRLQSLGESLYTLIDGTLVGPMIGPKGVPYIPFVFTIFMMVLTMNLMGLVLGLFNLGGLELTFTPTAQLAVTATLALLTFVSVVVIGFIKNGLGMYKLFVPSGVPWPMLFLLVPLEFISFMVRPLTLAMRLFGNMLGGHVVLAIFGAFVAALGAYALSTGGAAYAALIPSALSFFMVVALTALELIVGFLQAFVFAALACVYLNDVVNLGHGH